jgi:hypothetical protein
MARELVSTFDVFQQAHWLLAAVEVLLTRCLRCAAAVFGAVRRLGPTKKGYGGVLEVLQRRTYDTYGTRFRNGKRHPTQHPTYVQ